MSKPSMKKLTQPATKSAPAKAKKSNGNGASAQAPAAPAARRLSPENLEKIKTINGALQELGAKLTNALLTREAISDDIAAMRKDMRALEENIRGLMFSSLNLDPRSEYRLNLETGEVQDAV